MVRHRLGLVATLAACMLLAAPQVAEAVTGPAAIRVAAATSAVRDQARRHGPLHATVGVPPRARDWEVRFFAGRREVARVLVDRRTGRLASRVVTGLGLIAPSARGQKPTFRDRVDLATLVLCVLFVLPFVDPRRPFRMLHLDLLGFLALEVTFLLLQTEHLVASVWAQYPPLLYLLARFSWLGFRGPRGDRDDGPLVPYASDRLLAIALVVLVIGRLVFNVVWSAVGDVGYAGLFGADSLTHGYDLYGNSIAHLDSYGPINYFFYVPFALLFPLGPGWSHTNVQGAHLASITLDLAVVILLMLVGRKLRPGRRLALALGYAWAAYPLALFPLAVNSNDAMVALSVLAALLAYASPIGRGLALGLGAAAKFSPLGLVPAFALGRERSWRNAVVVCGLAAAVVGLTFVPYIRQSGLHTVWHSTLGFQLRRTSPFQIWGIHPALEPLHVLAQVMAIALALAAAWWPRERDLASVAALSAAVLLALQLAGNYWAHTYIAWFAAPGFIALFAPAARQAPAAGTTRRRSRSSGSS